ncbi:hypothetical protein PUN28_000789 [Cardiocondyla obscurior]|uniref:Uncharacterized protein n=1 Tax=Cardiocondyla obscurior TaxID=286306 RepID=A0AAW2H129_9HYME
MTMCTFLRVLGYGNGMPRRKCEARIYQFHSAGGADSRVHISYTFDENRQTDWNAEGRRGECFSDLSRVCSRCLPPAQGVVLFAGEASDDRATKKAPLRFTSYAPTSTATNLHRCSLKNGRDAFSYSVSFSLPATLLLE